MLVMSVTGATMVFEDEISAWMHPEWYQVEGAGGARVGMNDLIGAVKSKYPDHRIYRIFSPTTRRDTYLVIVEKQGKFQVTFAHPVTGAILGSAPAKTFMSSIWEVHANLLGGTTGRLVNCTIGIAVLLLPLSGLIVWWPGARQWWQALGVSRSNGRVTARSLHGAIGIWTFVFITMFATTGALYFYGPQFYRVLDLVSTRTSPPSPYSNSALENSSSRPDIEQLIARAQQMSPGRPVWAIYPPWSNKSSLQVILAPVSDDLGADVWEWDNTGYRYVYFDQHSGEILQQWDMTNPNFADFIRSWLAPLHRGSFGGPGIKALWVIFGLAPAMLFILGAWMWWHRVRRRPSTVAGPGTT